MSVPETIVQLRLDTGAVSMLAGREALEAWNLCIDALGPPAEDLATVVTHLGRRVVAYRVDQQPWRALNCFDVPTHIPTFKEISA